MAGRRCLLLGMFALLLLVTGCQQNEQTLRLGGGPAGGTFQGVAEALAAVLQPENLPMEVLPSGGSVANLVSLNRGELDLGLVYAGDAYLGRRGQLSMVQPAPKNVRLVARLYGAAAQLVVRQNSRYRAVSGLIGARIAIGNPGSGTAVAARRYFGSRGLWDQIVPIHVGFDMGLKELSQGSVDAVWMVVGFPNLALARQDSNEPLRWLDLRGEEGPEQDPFLKSFPFYRPVEIPPGTYQSQLSAVHTFQDEALLLARTGLPDETVFHLLRTLYAPKTLQAFAARHHLGQELRNAAVPPGDDPPLHAGAARYWKSRKQL